MLRVTYRLLSAACVLLIVAVTTAASATTGANPQASPAFGPPADTVLLGRLSPVDVAIRLAEQTPFDDVDRVLIAREDTFADALASATLQASAPLLLVGSDTVPPQVLAHVSELDPDEVVLLGGPAALSDDVADSFADAGYQVTRRAGASRVETAIDIAATDTPSATTALLVRAFPAITEVVIIGGEAAVGPAMAAAVADLDVDVTRLSGESRADTAVQVAAARGVDADGRVVLVDGEAPDGWVGGFTAAAHAAHFDAPILLAGSHGLPAQTTDALIRAAPDPAEIRLGVVSGDGRYVFDQYGHSPPDRSSYDLGFVRVARDGSHALVPTPYEDEVIEPDCESQPAIDGSSALTICDNDVLGTTDLVTIDYEVGTSGYVVLEDDQHGKCHPARIISTTPRSARTR